MSFEVPIAALAFLLMFGLLSQPSISATSSRHVCIGLGGWPCGYTGPFSGSYYAGYATLGCTAPTPNSTCVVPQIAIETGYLVIKNASYVIDWANRSLQFSNRPVDGSTITVSGKLDAIFYNKTAGSTYMIYYSNVKGLLNPQPRLQIQNATLTTHSVASTCTTTLSFTVSGPPNGIWNLPMIPTGACYTVSDVTQQLPHTVSNAGAPMWVIVLTLGGVIVAGAFAFLRNRRRDSAPSARGTRSRSNGLV
jgi:hypothetical protein